MAKERIISAATTTQQEETFNLSLRPESLHDYVGQPKLVEKLSITLAAVKQRKEPMEHVLLHGPPGLGKTTLAHIIANEMDTHVTVTAGPALTKPGDLVGILTKLQPHDVLFVDEIHRLQISLEEYLYSAMEDFKIDVQIDQGMHAKTITLPIKPFTLIGATTRAGMISGPMRSRFGITHNLEFYSESDLLAILTRSARLMNLIPSNSDLESIGDTSNLSSDILNALCAIASRSRGTPRIANRLLRRVRDFTQVKAGGELTPAVVDAALSLEGIDSLGIDDLDRKYMQVIADVYDGGPVGLEAIAATLGEDAGTLEEVVEPYLLQIGFLARTRKGRQLTTAAAQHLGLRISTSQNPADLFALED
ncbi:Holliday junction ATP-dependent DNA helicase RuvB [Poriferisphaera corsica]|uniref:Holliday junction branch migration complex subunit RuvB n=1 Tax=Poriferisphaera corsica TaxID=2528020 RepID=A0A517YXS2_9BACT|nr:Holliday junction branch migration DNA helicase RuvB [Poriferisphaera corsica]QDU35007.1 Holliday junction ATP-dependent DNA helicase RuvB [Poriferisphaera corsica]